MKTTTRAFRYLKAAQGPHSLSESWKLLSKPRRRYARYLVERYGYPVKLAIQQAYIFGFDAWPYDYRAGRSVREERTAKDFGL